MYAYQIYQNDKALLELGNHDYCSNKFINKMVVDWYLLYQMYCKMLGNNSYLKTVPESLGQHEINDWFLFHITKFRLGR